MDFSLEYGPYFHNKCVNRGIPKYMLVIVMFMIKIILRDNSVTQLPLIWNNNTINTTAIIIYHGINIAIILIAKNVSVSYSTWTTSNFLANMLLTISVLSPLTPVWILQKSSVQWYFDFWPKVSIKPWSCKISQRLSSMICDLHSP